MKTILLPFLDDDTAESALQSAQVIAKRHGSYIEAVYVLTHEPYIAAGGLAFSGGFYPVPSPGDRDRVDTAYARFTHQLTEHGLPLCNVQDAPEGASASWRETAGIESYLLGEIGRLFDLVVVGRTSSRSAVDWSAIFEGALFDSGKPVLVAPESAPETIGDNIVVYWNCSTENARTISLGMPFLVRAEKVTVVTVTGALEPGPDGAELVKYLKRCGVAATADSVGAKGYEAAGAAVLDYAKEAGADLLLKGAYTHSRIRQMIFGGATREILANAELPVLFAH